MFESLHRPYRSQQIKLNHIQNPAAINHMECETLQSLFSLRATQQISRKTWHKHSYRVEPVRNDLQGYAQKIRDIQSRSQAIQTSRQDFSNKTSLRNPKIFSIRDFIEAPVLPEEESFEKYQAGGVLPSNNLIFVLQDLFYQKNQNSFYMKGQSIESIDWKNVLLNNSRKVIQCYAVDIKNYKYYESEQFQNCDYKITQVSIFFFQYNKFQFKEFLNRTLHDHEASIYHILLFCYNPSNFSSQKTLLIERFYTPDKETTLKYKVYQYM